jgi:membrane dipeptidase
MTTVDSLPVLVGHQDTLLSLYMPERGHGRGFFERSEFGHIDLPRALEGGLVGSFFAIFVPSCCPDGNPNRMQVVRTEQGYEIPMESAVDLAYAQQTTMAMMALLFRLERESKGQLQIVHGVSEMERNIQQHVHSAILHFEGAEAIDTDLNALEVFYQAGLRSLGIVWSRPNAFACGVPFKFPSSPDTGPGLTDAGRELVKACNSLGIMLDLSHLNERGFWDVAALSEAPLVATHSNVHAICPSTRNLTDKQLDAIGESGGVVGLNFAVYDLREDAERDTNVPLELLVRHIDYLVEHVTIDGVAIGSDFDGTTIPQKIQDASGLPKLLDALRIHGYDEVALRKIAYENWLRVLSKTWKA